MFSCDCARHQIGTHCVSGFRSHAFRACTNSPKTAKHFGHITACEFDQDDVPWAYGIPRFDNLCGLLAQFKSFTIVSVSRCAMLRARFATIATAPRRSISPLSTN